MCSASIPVSLAVGTPWSTAVAAVAASAVSMGVIRTPASDPLPQRLAALRAELVDLLRAVPAAGGRRRAGVLPGQRPHRDERRSGQRVGVVRGGGRRLRGRPVHAEPGQGRRRRLRRAPTSGRCRRWCRRASSSTRLPQPADAADAAALALCHLRWRRSRSALPCRSRLVADDRVAARPGARTRSRRVGADRGRRCRLRRPRLAAGVGRARAVGAGLPLRPSPHPGRRPTALRIPHARRARRRSRH